MSRVINPDGVGKERKRLTRAVVLAIRELMQQPEPNAETRDLAAFLAIAIEAIAETIDRTVAPWEKRGYWVKADRFRMKWIWSEQVAQDMRKAVLAEDWGKVALLSVKTAEKLSTVNVPARHRLGTPWVGAWEKMREK